MTGIFNYYEISDIAYGMALERKWLSTKKGILRILQKGCRTQESERIKIEFYFYISVMPLYFLVFFLSHLVSISDYMRLIDIFIFKVNYGSPYNSLSKTMF